MKFMDELEIVIDEYLRNAHMVESPEEQLKKCEDAVKTSLADSGDRTEFGTGAQRDMGGTKGRCDLLPAKALLRMLYSEAPTELTTTSMVNQGFLNYLAGDDDLDYLSDVARWAMERMEEETPNNILDWVAPFYPNATLRLARHYENGAKKYADRNWEKGLPISSFIDSGYRHFLKYVAGWTDEDHLAAVAWNVLGAMWTEDMYPELQDLPSRKGPEEID